MYTKAFAILLFTGKTTTSKLISFLEKRKLLSLLPGIHKELTTLQKEREEKDMVTIETPFLLEDAALLSIQSIVGAEPGTKEKVKENKKLLSGFRAIYKGKSYDASGERIIRELISK